jgi:Lysyl oxidase
MTKKSRVLWTLLPLLALGSVGACSDESDDAGGGGAGGEGGSASEAPGALIQVTTSSQVGVLLDELPEEMRDTVAAALIKKPASYYVARAKRQLALTSYRLNFRDYFYDEEDKKKQLPLPPEAVLDIEIVPNDEGALARRAEIDGHDYVVADYTVATVIVTDVESPSISEPTLIDIGDTWVEDFIFPVDPELLFQRTGYACMDEAEFPPNSVDSEDVEFFYDQTCEVEEELTKDGCHYTALPNESCIEALDAHVGQVALPLKYELIAWDDAIADKYRLGEVKTEGGADLEVVTEELSVNRLTYRYIDDDSCALAEACVGGTGWRRLLQFNASEKNVGDAPVVIGDIDYFLDDASNPTANANHNLYQFSACHGHYHFNYFATFTYGDDPDLGSKRAFCLESVARYSNHEQSPSWSDYNSCYFQGISEGWGDQYNAGIECQWIDVTTVDVSDGPVTQALGLRSNPEGFLCEGTPVVDDDGFPTWESTDILTDLGDTVDRPVCEESDDWDATNYGELDVTLPILGEGLITSPCTRGQLGPLRDCGFTYDGETLGCTPGESVSLSCTIPDDAKPQVVRVCEASHVLQTGTACMNAHALTSATIADGSPVSLTFECPDERSVDESGGLYALYQGPVWPEDTAAEITCTVD